MNARNFKRIAENFPASVYHAGELHTPTRPRSAGLSQAWGPDRCRRDTAQPTHRQRRGELAINGSALANFPPRPPCSVQHSSLRVIGTGNGITPSQLSSILMYPKVVQSKHTRAAKILRSNTIMSFLGLIMASRVCSLVLSGKTHLATLKPHFLPISGIKSQYVLQLMQTVN